MSRSPYIGSPLAEFFRFMLQFLCLQMCVYGGSAVSQGGGGGGWGTVFPGVGNDKGGGVPVVLSGIMREKHLKKEPRPLEPPFRGGEGALSPPSPNKLFRSPTTRDSQTLGTPPQ